MKEPNFDYSKLRGRIVEILGNQNELASRLGISLVSLSRKLNNKVRFSTDDIITIAEVLKIPDAEIGIYFFTLKVSKN